MSQYPCEVKFQCGYRTITPFYASGKNLYDKKLYAEVPSWNAEYTILVQNRSGATVKAVVTVDGLSVMSGKDGSLQGAGYLISPYETLEIPGFRLDNDSVARFQFGGKQESYASKVGKPTNVGVIGVAVYRERQSHCVLRNTGFQCNQFSFGESTGDAPPLYGHSVCNSSQNYCCSEIKTSGGPVQNVGTGFGRKAVHHVDYVRFDSEDSPCQVLEIFYDDRPGLVSKGIIGHLGAPVAFPGVGCTPPPGWKSY